MVCPQHVLYISSILAQGPQRARTNMRGNFFLRFSLLFVTAAILCAMASLVWDALRENGINDYLTLACVKESQLVSLVGPDLVDTAMKERDIGQSALHLKLHQVSRDGLPQPPPPMVKETKWATPVVSQINQKPFKLPNKVPKVEARSSSETIHHKDVSKEVETKQDARHQILVAFWAYFMALGEHSFLWSERFHSEAFLEKAREVMIEDWKRCNKLAAYLQTLKSWIEYNEKLNLDWRTPDSITMRDFLKSFRGSGSSVPKANFDGIRWIHQNLGLNSTTDLERVRRTVDTPASHQKVQANPLKILIMSVISNAMKSHNIFVSSLAIFWNLLVTAVIRPAHLQRTRISFGEDFIIGHAYRGKKKVRGHNAPFNWASPRYDALGGDIQAALVRMMKHTKAASEDRPFILPEFAPARADWATATGFMDIPMPLPKVLRLLGLYLKAMGVSQEDIDGITGLYSGRRVLPSVADYAQKPPEFRLDVGGWTDTNTNSRLSMPNLYSNARLNTQARRKKELLVMINLAYGKFCHATHASNLKPEMSPEYISPSWDMLFRHWPSFDETEFAMNSDNHLLQVRPTLDDHVMSDASDDEFWENLAQTAPAAKYNKNDIKNLFSDESSSSSSSSSDAAEEKECEDLDEDAEDEIFPLAAKRFKWFASKGQHGRLHLCDGETLCCGRVLKMPDDGCGLDAALATGKSWSPRCWAALSTSAKAWWANAHRGEQE